MSEAPIDFLAVDRVAEVGLETLSELLADVKAGALYKNRRYAR